MRTPPLLAVCQHCGYTYAEHFGVNFADGPHVSGAVLVCPTAVYRSSEKEGHHADASTEQLSGRQP